MATSFGQDRLSPDRVSSVTASLSRALIPGRFVRRRPIAMTTTGINAGRSERDIQDVVLALVGEHGTVGALRIAETFVAGSDGNRRLFWQGVAKEIRARQG